MKLIEFKEYNNIDDGKALNKKKIIVFAVIFIIILLSVIFSVIYMCNSKFRNWADTHILMKNITQGTLSSIDIDTEEDISIFAYDQYVALLNNNKLNIYNSSGKQLEELDVSVSNPIFTSNGKYLLVAEKEKQKVYLISGTKIIWSTDIDGIISRTSVNENGYTSIICSGTTYKSVIIVFDQKGNQILKSYIPSNSVVDSVVSSDNKYLSFAEVDTTGTLIKSTVKTIAINNSGDSSNITAVNTYEMDTNTLVVNLKYQGSKNLICMCNNGVYLLSDGTSELMMNFNEEDKKYTFSGINLTNSIYRIEEITDGVSNQSSQIKLLNTGTKKVNNYSINGIAKSTSSAGDNIAINLGTEVYFINSKGWLKKKYQSNEEVRNIIISERIAAIVYRDKVEILVL